jgi:damage-control phosphatase, subfamily I
MNAYLDCFPCFVKQALSGGRMATDDEHKLKLLLDSIGGMIKDIPVESTPPETGELIYAEVSRITGCTDPYKEKKAANIAEALRLYPELKKIVAVSDDHLLTAIRIAIAGNVIDFGVSRKFDIEKDVTTILKQDFGHCDYDVFRNKLAKAKTVLYLGDNAGESVFDKILIEELKRKVVFVVRDCPVINDATRQDAIDSGLDKVARIMSSGSRAPGIVPKLCSHEFMEIFNNADLVISKGQGNYEGLSNVKRPVFFLLKAKCNVIAKDIGVRLNDIVLKAINVN